MNDRFLVERIKRRGMAGHYVPDPGRPPGLPISPAVAAAVQAIAAGAPATVAASMAAAAGPIPQTPSHLPLSVLRPQQQMTRGPLGRNMSFEEAMGHRLWQSHFTMDGGNQLIQVPLNLRQPFAVRRAPWLDMPAGGEPFLYPNNAAITLPAGPLPTTTVVISFQVPRRKNGCIEFIANQLLGNWNQGTADLVWQLLADGVPFKGFNNIIFSIGNTGQPADLRESPIRIFENQVIELVVINNSVMPNQQALLGLLRGKFWPVEQEGPNTWV